MLSRVRQEVLIVITQSERVDNTCLKDTKSGALATGAGKEFLVIIIDGKKLI
jgi:hypothetical protein